MKNKIKILVIDDEEALLEVIAEQIESFGEGFEVLTAKNVSEAQKKIQFCDAILSDMKMPDRNGLERLLKTTKKPYARMSGDEGHADDLILSKPFRIEDLNRIILSLVQRIEFTCVKS